MRVAKKGSKNVAAAISAESGGLITAACAVNALGNYAHCTTNVYLPRKTFVNILLLVDLRAVLTKRGTVGREKKIS